MLESILSFLVRLFLGVMTLFCVGIALCFLACIFPFLLIGAIMAICIDVLFPETFFTRR